MPFEMKIRVSNPPFRPLTKEEITHEEAVRFMQDLVEEIKKDPDWTVRSSSAPAPSGDTDRWHEFELIKGPLHEKHGLNKDGV